MIKSIRKFSIVFLTGLIILSCLWIETSKGLIMIEGEQNGASNIILKLTDQDDPNDNDQSFQETELKYLQIDNGLRRHLGVYIDRIILGQGTTVIDNGRNDEVIGPASEIFVYETLAQLWACAVYGNVDCIPPPASRTYILPLPDELNPGTQVRFRIKAMGPAILGQLPFPLFEDPPPEARLLIDATVLTTMELLILPMISTLTGAVLPEGIESELLQDIATDFSRFISSEPAYVNALIDGDYFAIGRVIFLFLAESEAVVKGLEAFGMENSASALNAIQNFILSPMGIADLSNTLLQLLGPRWYEEYNVWFVVPRVDELVPSAGNVGDTIVINGAGFDPYEPENNTVYFSKLNPQGTPVPSAEAQIVEVVDEEHMEVIVPEEFTSGPVMVCTRSSSSIGEPAVLCSNWDVDFTEPLPSTLTITSPSDGATVSGMIDITAEVIDPPDPFPTSQATLYVDGIQVDQMQVTSATFSFSYNTEGMAEGSHTLRVELLINGQMLDASVDVMFIGAGTDPYLIIHSPPVSGANFAKNQAVTVQVEVANGPEPTVYSGGGFADFRLYLDGIMVTSRSLEIGTSTFPGCYSATLGFLDFDIDEGLHTVRVEAYSSSLQSGDDYNLVEEFDITIGPPAGDPNTIDLSGNMCDLDLLMVFMRKDQMGNYYPLDVNVVLGYCCELYLPHIFEDRYQFPQILVMAGYLTDYGQFASILAPSLTTLMGSTFRVYMNQNTGWDIIYEYYHPGVGLVVSIPVLAGRPPPFWEQATRVGIRLRSPSSYLWGQPPQCP